MQQQHMRLVVTSTFWLDMITHLDSDDLNRSITQVIFRPTMVFVRVRLRTLDHDVDQHDASYTMPLPHGATSTIDGI